ncbi:hypothetical protein L838_0375 [Mycobacterium avium MAV_120709_2344]|uniref:Uncharacterized protein n=1 Tax=Mycobacterium indicus pranii (strain DSM 45239 / MTCC 9506) TaxID=1232724 RepID=J9WCA4_MYCIP|nr:Hypothetical protein MIP_04207 [Mycobacterium intracellulare subsp. intracellulare MTCC 9506]ETZ37653.1 hypothetical protein L839_4785 [Mycobacterium avium MAV_120809_2495]ETZ37783.1 hypothetical protein L839_4777 [Mycobacterium avium MAV_120809_2495]ETZ39213.1 hypothetical protein L842_5904 [Mycobacterium intracellulare MIN_052511_1280]ETZ57321.1 hypothetical protein L838_0375 [Mycobacterium avium MAV_120709_2344]
MTGFIASPAAWSAEPGCNQFGINATMEWVDWFNTGGTAQARLRFGRGIRGRLGLCD